MTSTVDRLAVELAPRRKAKAPTEPSWPLPPTPQITQADLDEVRLATADASNAAATLKARLDALDGVVTGYANDVRTLKDAAPAAVPTEEIDAIRAALQKHAEAINTLAARPVAPPAPSRVSEAVLGALRAIAMVLAVRVLLVLALAGSFALAVMAMVNQSPLSLGLTVAFALLSLAPLVYLETRRSPPTVTAPE